MILPGREIGTSALPALRLRLVSGPHLLAVQQFAGRVCVPGVMSSLFNEMQKYPPQRHGRVESEKDVRRPAIAFIAKTRDVERSSIPDDLLRSLCLTPVGADDLD